jgi:hypothetical protein
MKTETLGIYTNGDAMALPLVWTEDHWSTKQSGKNTFQK